jgi:hypothetical protein
MKEKSKKEYFAESIRLKGDVIELRYEKRIDVDSGLSGLQRQTGIEDRKRK